MKKCPYCKEEIQDDAIKCKHCGEFLDESAIPRPSRGKDSFGDTPIKRPVQESFAEGTLIAKQGRFQQMAKIGEGGMGRVYKAYDSVMEEWVALKTLPPELVDKPELLKRFIREAKETRKLSHPNIIRIHDVFEIDHILYIAMEFVDGIDLKSLIKEKGALPLDEVRELFQQICNGLSYAHSQGVIHRDIKPQNILIDQSGRAKITDFGIAKALETTGFTRTGQMLGTPAYMSPEQADAKNVDNRSDIYSLGVVLYEMLTGDIPFKADSPVAMGIKHLKETPPMPRQIRQDLPEAWEKIVLKCLAKRPDQRFLNIDEIITFLPAAEKGRHGEEEERKRETERLNFEPEMVYVPEGEFIMGSNDDKDEKPIHRVFLDAYWIGKYPVTNQEYAEFLKETNYKKPAYWDESRFNGPRQPVVGVSWYDAKSYCEWLSRKSGKNYRLPTEAEWEKAARGIDGRKYPWGNQKPDRSYSNYTETIMSLFMGGVTTNVDDYPKGASPYGAMDMAGNVWEWVADWYDENYYGNSPERNPQGPESGSYKVVRGGAWGDVAGDLRASNRLRVVPENRYHFYSLGFRCSRD